MHLRQREKTIQMFLQCPDPDVPSTKCISATKEKSKFKEFQCPDPDAPSSTKCISAGEKRIPMPRSRTATHTTDMANDGPFGVPSLVFDGRCKFWSPISCFRWQMKMGKINTRAALWPPPNQPPFVFDPTTKHGRRQIPGGSRFKSFAAAVSASATKIDSVSSELSKNPTTPNLLS